MVTAHVHLAVTAVGENDPRKYTIDRRKLRAAALALSQLQALGWSCTFDPFRGLEDGIVEWSATKRFAAAGLAGDEVLSLPGWRKARPDRGDREHLLLVANAAHSTEETSVNLTFDDSLLRGPRCFVDEHEGDEIEVAYAPVSRRVLLANAPSRAGSHDHLRVRRADGSGVFLATAAAFRADPEATIGSIVDALLGHG